jgi:hypothetical protein
MAAKPTIPNLVVFTQISTSPLDEISDHFDHLPLQACVKLIRLLLMSISSLPRGAARPQDAMKTVILSVAEYGSTSLEDGAGQNPTPRLLECGWRAQKETLIGAFSQPAGCRSLSLK